MTTFETAKLFFKLTLTRSGRDPEDVCVYFYACICNSLTIAIFFVSSLPLR